VLQWCPTGLFSFLPIHAAGCYDDDLAVECASDYIISSYTPTISALLTPDPIPSTSKPFKMMVVIQSKELSSTQKELKKIEQHVPNNSLIRLGIPGSPAFVETVASCLSDVSIAHFAYHGKQHPFQPLESGLKLEDGFLFVSRIMKEPTPNGSLAFLCACDTAMGDEKLPDEAMSLAASLLFSGFQHVIATMW
jgi:CHAT domain-containing protein